MMRSSALSLALGYVALGLTALVLFAAPLWYAWQVTIQDGRAEILQADAQRLTDIYRRDGAEALKAFIDTRVSLQIAGERILLLCPGAPGCTMGAAPVAEFACWSHAVAALAKSKAAEIGQTPSAMSNYTTWHFAGSTEGYIE